MNFDNGWGVQSSCIARVTGKIQRNLDARAINGYAILRFIYCIILNTSGQTDCKRADVYPAHQCRMGVERKAISFAKVQENFSN